jgi:2'-5' RNA ligase
MIRLFVAVEVPQDIRLYLKDLGRGIPGARPLPAEQIHLTLCFLGEVERSLFQDVRECLFEVEKKPFSLQISGVGHFPPRGTPKVLWAGVTPTDELVRLKKRVDRALQTCGLELEKRKFSPHITLARLRNSPIQRVSEFLAGNSFLQTPKFTVDSFHLFSSRLGKRKAVFPISGAGADCGAGLIPWNMGPWGHFSVTLKKSGPCLQN